MIVENMIHISLLIVAVHEICAVFLQNIEPEKYSDSKSEG